MSRFGPRPPRPYQDQQFPVDRSRRGSPTKDEHRLLVRKNSRDYGPGEQNGADGGRRSRNRSSSTPPESRTYFHPQQNGSTMLLSASASASWAHGEHWVNTSWNPRHAQTVEVQMSSQCHMGVHMVVHGGQLGDDRRGRGRHSSDARRPHFIQSAPVPKPAHSTPSSPAEPPVIPRFTTSGGMGLRNLLRKASRDRQKIFFYHKHEPHYGFTNFSPHAVKYNGKVYPTSEHLFQALKFTHKPGLMEHIRTCDPRPSVALTEARRFAHEVRPDWKNENIRAMDIVLREKFNQHNSLRRELLSTGDAELIEDSDKDSFWGCGADRKGRNELGKALMRLRKFLLERERR